MMQAQVIHAVLQKQTPIFPPFMGEEKLDGQLHDLFVQ